MRWVGHVAHWARGEVHTSFWWGNLRERDLLEEEDNIKMDFKHMVPCIMIQC